MARKYAIDQLQNYIYIYIYILKELTSTLKEIENYSLRISY